MHPPFGRRALSVALAVTLMALGAACSSDREAASAPAFGTVAGTVPTGPLPPPLATTAPAQIHTVAMVGDSITVGSREALEAGFASLDLDDAEINAESGRRMISGTRISSGREAIEEITAAGPPPDLWVVALGTNDVGNYRPEEYAAVIAELLAGIPADAPVVWVDTYLDDYQDRADQFNEALRTVLATRGHASVVDWASVAAEDGVLTDGVHPSGFGVEEFSRRVVTAVDNWQA
ncbi:MAG: GDSL-type esterase/lipase family protein [Ilumatobacteraceae bacterium]